MSRLPVGSLLCALMLHVSLSLKSFREDGIFNYSTMLMRDELGLLLLGAREAVYALDINDISDKKAAVRTFQETCRQCSAPSGCKMPSARSILTSLTLAFSMYVCGTNAFSPTCAYMTFVNGQLRLEGKQEEGKGKCPFDPFQRYASLMVGNDLYSATSINFLGSEPVVLRSSDLALRTEFKSSWLSEPNFVYMDFVRESFDSPEGDDDKVYLFFSENAMEYDFYSKVAVSRVARVCKVKLTSLLLCMSQTSVVCAYSVSAIRDIFDKGKFKTPVAVETSHVKWVMYSGEVPVPRPGACINNVARKMGMNRSLDLPDKTLQFIRDRPLMDEAVHPLTGGPLLVKKGALLTRIVVDSVVALDGKRYHVCNAGDAVNYDGEMFIIEEIQLYNESVPISTLRLSARKGQLYAGSEFGAVQMPVSNCSSYDTCVDCILARDPYCAWDFSTEQCSSVRNSSDAAAQSLKEGDVSRCPQPGRALHRVTFNNILLPCQVHSNLAQLLWRLSDQALHSNSKYYIHSGGLLILSASESDAGLYSCDSVEQINGKTFNRTVAVYRLELSSGPGVGSTTPGTAINSSDSSHGANTTANPDPEDPLAPENQSGTDRVAGLEVAVALLSLFCLSLLGVVLWIWSQGRVGCFKFAQRSTESEGKRQSAEYAHIQNRTSEIKLLGPEPARPRSANNNHSAVDFKENGEHRFTPMANISSLDGLGYINDESEI
uniref:Uncharacterized protein n=1 Tax=Mola mola TaxID=94237 RepID=A0A3Q3VM41_MOLML